MWAIIELMGHNVLAGFITPDATYGGLIRIDVPQTTEQPAFTKIVNPSAIYAINPVTEEIAKIKAESWQETPYNVYDVRSVIEAKIRELAPEKLKERSLPETFDFENEDDEAEMF